MGSKPVRFGSYNKTWGSLSAVVVMLTWLWLSSVALLFGAEVNKEAEVASSGGASLPRSSCKRRAKPKHIPQGTTAQDRVN